MIVQPNPTTLATDPTEFRRSLVIPAAHGPARFGDVMAPFQRRDFEALDRAFLSVLRGERPSPRFLWIERTKKSSKDMDIAVELAWVLAFSRPLLENILAAGDQIQAEEPRKRFDSLLRLNPYLGSVLRSDRFKISNGRTGSVCSIVTSDPRTTPGQLPNILVCNELTAMTEAFFDEVFENALGNPSAVVVVLTNAGHLGTWQWRRRQRAIESDLWYFSAYSRPAPWHSAVELAERRKDIAPQRYSRLWGGQWVHEAGDAIEIAAIDRAVDEGYKPHTSAQPGFVYALGCDLSASRDHSAVIMLARSTDWTEQVREPEPILPSPIRAAIDAGVIPAPPRKYKTIHHPGDGKTRLVHVRSWKPSGASQVPYDQIEDHIVELHRRYRFSTALLDQWNETYICQRLRSRGVPTSVFHNSSTAEQQAMAIEMLGGFQDGRFVLFDAPELVADLRRCQVIDKGTHVRIDWPRGKGFGHCDRGSAFGLAVLASKRAPAGVQYRNRPLHLIWTTPDRRRQRREQSEHKSDEALATADPASGYPPGLAAASPPH